MIISFYSYKGGVGRTSLALDTAARLALGSEDRPPLRVLVWDLDLDAPGVRHFPALQPLAQRATAGTHDLLALLGQGTDAAGEEHEVSEAEVLDVLRRSIVSDPELAGGRLALLLPSGSHTAQRGSADADPTGLFGPGAPGPSLLVLAADLVRRELGFDVIVVDARTGVNDLAATATTVLADCAVLVFRLDGQDVSHLSEIATAIHAAWDRAGAATADLPNRLYRVANLVPSGDPVVLEAVTRRRHELAQLRLEPHLELPLRPLALVRESTPRLDGPELDGEAELAVEGLADWAYQRWADLLRREGAQPAKSVEISLAREASSVAKRFEDEVAALLRLGGWRVTVAATASEGIDLWAEKTGEFGRRQVLLIECKASRRGATTLDVERLGELTRDASRADGTHCEGMLVARRFTASAAAAAKLRNVLLVRPEDLLDDQAPGAPLRQRARQLWEGTALERQYVPPTAVVLDAEGAHTADEAPLDQHALSWVHNGKLGLLCVLGDFGAGKTTFCQRLAVDLAADESRTAPLPLYVDLRAAGSTALTLDGLLRHALDEAKVDQPRLEPWRHRLVQGSLVLLVDGFDELLGYTDPTRMEGLLEELHQAATVGRVVLTSRSSYFRSDREAARTLRGQRAKPGKRAGTALWDQLQRWGEVTALEVKPFDDEQVNRYLTQRFGETHVERILPQLRALHPVDDLLRRPYLLTLVATSIDQWEARGWPTRLTLTSVYESYVADWLERDKHKQRGLPAEPAGLAQHLARVLWNRPSAQIGSRELRSEAAAWGSAVSNRPISPDEEETIEAKVRTALFLVRDERGDYRFAHRSFLEFFVAKGLADALRRQLSLEELRVTLDIARLTPEIAAFMVGWPESWAEVPEACRAVLESPPTHPRASANALLLTVWHGRGNLDANPSAERLPVSIGSAALAKVDLSRADLATVMLSGADLSGADLSGADLSGADLTGADLTGINAARVNLIGANLQHAQLLGAVLSEARLTDARLCSADLVRCNLRAASLRDADLAGCNLTGAVLNEADLSGAATSNTDLSHAQLLGATADDVDFRDVNLDGADLRFASLRGADLPAAANANLYAARLTPERHAIQGAKISHIALIEPEAVSPIRLEGKSHIAIGCADGSVWLWDPEPGYLRVAHRTHTHPIRSLCVIERGNTSALASSDEEGTIVLWDPEAGCSVIKQGDGVEPGVAPTLCRVTTSRGEHLLAAAEGSLISIWDVEQPDSSIELDDHKADVLALCQIVLPDGTCALASAGEDQLIRLWDLGAHKLIATLAGHNDWIRALCPVQLPDGTHGLASAGDDGAIRLWDLREHTQIATLTGHNDWIRALCPVQLPDGTHSLASAGDDDGIRLWDLRQQTQIATLAGHNNWIRALGPVQLPDGTHSLISSDANQGICLWDLEHGDLLTSVTGEAAPIETALPAALPGGHLGMATVDSLGAIKLWDVERGELLIPIAHTDRITAECPFTLPDGSAGIALSTGDRTCIWNTEQGLLAANISHRGSERIRAICQTYLADGRPVLASASTHGVIRVWDPDDGGLLWASSIHRSTILALCSPPYRDGAQLLVSAGGDQTIFTSVFGADEPDRTIGQHDARITALCPARIGSHHTSAVASADVSGTIHLWHLEGGDPIVSLRDGEARIQSLCALILNDGSHALASADSDGMVRLWHLERQQLLASFPEFPGPVRSVSSLKLDDGTTALASVGGDGTLRIRSLVSDRVMRIVSVLSASDWIAYREGSVVDGGETAAWGTKWALDNLLLVGDRWCATDVWLTYPETLRTRVPRLS